jgi:hypothetical protein
MNRISQAELELTIVSLISYYQERFEEAKSFDVKLATQRRLCFLAIIDGLSGFSFPNLGVRERVIKFLNEVVLWENGNRVSFIQLRAWIYKTNHATSPELKKYIESEYKLLSPGDFQICSHIEMTLPDFIQRFGDCEYFSRFTQSNLLYKYRNALVHESLMKSGNFPSSGIDEPYYVAFYGSGSNSDGEPTPDWVLYYPECFLENLCQESILTCRKYLITNGIDPYKPDNNPEFWN